MSGTHGESWKGTEVAEAMAEAAAVARQVETREHYPFWLLLEALERLEGGSLLELGCGTGHNLDVVAREMPGRFTLAGSDYSSQMVDVATREVPHARFFVADVRDTALDLSGYDVLLAAGLIEVLDDWRPVLERLLAAPGQHVVLHRQRITRFRPRVEVEDHYAGRRTYRVYLPIATIRRLARRHRRYISGHYMRPGEDHHTFVLTRRA